MATGYGTGDDGYNHFEWPEDTYHEREEIGLRLYMLKRDEAAEYIDDFNGEGVTSLASYVDASSLRDMFIWGLAPQGYDFWKECYLELLSVGAEEVSDEPF